MRVAILVAWIAIMIVLLLPLLRRRGRPARRPLETSDELVKDPVCGTYVVRSRAIGRTVSGAPRYFCSDECANRDHR